MDSAGGELFSGHSLLSSLLSEPGPTDDEEPCPETLRSSIFVRIDDNANAAPDIDAPDIAAPDIDAAAGLDTEIEVTFEKDDEHAA